MQGRNAGGFRRILLLTVCPLAVAVACAPAIAQVSTAAPVSTSPGKPPPAGVAPTPPAKTPKPNATALANTGEAVIVTGTRSLGRKARDSTSPIDVITSATLRRAGQPNLADALVRTDPSINTTAEGADTADLTSALVLRGLNPNDTLVLIDGKRRNGTANITADAGPEQGATPVDINMIPAAAIDHIEVLRDGAAAQYGSDAIAGVINVIMKKADHGTDASALTGANAYNGDGWQYLLNADQGAAFGNDGYLHLGGQLFHVDHYITHTTDDRTGRFDNYITGLPEETRETLSLDFGKTLLPGIQGYGLITYGHRHAEAYENYRLPSILPQLFPQGFNPIETDEENQYSATLGIKGDDLFGFRWDLSTTYGADEITIGNKNTANPNLFAATGFTPTDVKASSLRNGQWTNTLDLSRPLAVLHVPFVLSFGAEHRYESYDIGAGNPGSYVLGGTQGFAGLLPANAGSFSRDVWAGYIDTDFHPLRHLDVDVAGRFEHYTDSGNTETGKISSRYDFTRTLAVRGTISNGFRAPTLAEEHFSSLNVSPTGASGDLAVSSAAARLLGAVPLKPERSTNASAGFVVDPVRNMSITTDIYQINIRDRIIGGGNYNGPLAIQAIALTGASLPASIQANDVSAFYFSNGASTRTQGADVNVNYSTDFGEYGNVNWLVGVDLNRTRLHHLAFDTNGKPLLSAAGISNLTTEFPRSKILLDAFWRLGRWDVNVRQTRYGQTSANLQFTDLAPAALQFSNTVYQPFVNTPRWLTDLEVGYRLTRHLHIAVGGNNLFNIRPRLIPLVTNYLGSNPYDQASDQVPISGGFYYGRVNLTF